MAENTWVLNERRSSSMERGGFRDFTEGQARRTRVRLLREALRKRTALDKRSLLRTTASGACVALRETGMLINHLWAP